MKALVSPDIEAYAEAHSMTESDVCRELREETFRTMELPQMVVGPLEGACLKLMAQLVGATRILEVGTFTGYSALCFAEVLPEGGQILTCDVDPEAAMLAQQFFAKSPHGSKIDLRLGPALETMSTLNSQFDLVFIDADKLNYVNYYQKAMELLSPNGVILVDNVLWNGDVLLHPAPDESTEAIQELNRVVAADPRVSSVLLTIRDGLLVITPKPR